MPLLPHTRLSEVRSDVHSQSALVHNLRFLLHGLSDHAIAVGETNPPLFMNFVVLRNPARRDFGCSLRLRRFRLGMVQGTAKG